MQELVLWEDEQNWQILVPTNRKKKRQPKPTESEINCFANSSQVREKGQISLL